MRGYPVQRAVNTGRMVSAESLMSEKRENDSFLYFFPRKIRLGDGERNEAGWKHGFPYSPESG